MPEVEQTAKIKEQIDRSRLAADRVDGHVRRSRAWIQCLKHRRPTSFAPISESRPGSLNPLLTRRTRKLGEGPCPTFFDSGAKLRDWEAIQ